MLSVVCWKWRPRHLYRSTFGPQTVNVLRNMVARNYKGGHRFICVTDDDRGLDAGIEVLPLWDEFAHILNPFGQSNPSCYRRLRAFHPDAAQYFGERFVSIDLDCVITGDVTPLWDCEDDFKIWGDTSRGTPYNGSMFLLKAGARPQVWEQFDPIQSPQRTRAKGYFGSDQAWISLCLGPGEKRWTKEDGVYSWRNQLKPRRGILPDDARVIFFHGQKDPWDREIITRHAWVREHWC